jgi:hypothetical protein
MLLLNFHDLLSNPLRCVLTLEKRHTPVGDFSRQSNLIMKMIEKPSLQVFVAREGEVGRLTAFSLPSLVPP